MVAQPSAMPMAPLHNRTGNWAGSTTGSTHSPSKVSTICTAWSSSSAVNAAPAGDSRISVYRSAAGMSPWMRGNAPWPSMIFTRWKSAASSAAAPYIDVPPCGCRLPVTAEQTLEDF